MMRHLIPWRARHPHQIDERLGIAYRVLAHLNTDKILVHIARIPVLCLRKRRCELDTWAVGTALLARRQPVACTRNNGRLGGLI